VITLNAPDVYTALERGTIDVTAWTQIGVMDANWDRYLKFRIDPSFFSTDLVIILNQKKWNSLSQKSRDILTRVAIEHEQASMKTLTDLRTKEYAELEKRGVKVVSLPPEASRRFVESARAASLARMKERMEKSGGIENYERVVKLLSPL
jgi:TRAP-type C4-dicarboxylate transport system substrate-binding protein